MVRRAKGTVNIYTNYMEKIYENDICVLCDQNVVDDREHYIGCEFSKEKWEILYKEIDDIMSKNNINKYYRWFGNAIQTSDEMCDLEIIIATFDREYANRLYVPMGLKEYMQMLGIKKDVKKIINEISIK